MNTQAISTTQGSSGLSANTDALSAVRLLGDMPAWSRRGRPGPDLDGIFETLRTTAMFADLGDWELHRLAKRCCEQSLPENSLIFRRGDAADALFIIREGDVVVFRDQPGKPVEVLARPAAGEILGELGMLHDVKHELSARTTEPCRLIRIEKRLFSSFLKEHVYLAARLESLAARRYRQDPALEDATRTNVRIRVGAEVTLVPSDGRCRSATLVNISRGGLSLSGVHPNWGPQLPVSFTLIGRDCQLDVTGRVAWQHDGTAGLAFTGRASNQINQVLRFTRRLLEKPTPGN